ncbi:MAG: glucuronate isomerase [Clostridia bacterium]|nr:glucuronate isomerase [Clostridia bacterium]
MKNTYLLKTENARRLYEDHARNLPIIDFHNHISVADIAKDRRFENLTELWLSPDPYKHRLMRICGVAEHYITGDAAPFEKFEKYCEIFPHLAGNPVYDWSRMELFRVFGIEEAPSRETARRIYDKAGEMLQSAEFSNNAILARFRVEYQSPVASITDDLSFFDGKRVAPSLRGDNLLLPTPSFLAGLGRDMSDLEDYITALTPRLDAFHRAGCRFADHALDAGFRCLADDGQNDARFVQLLKGETLSSTDSMRLSTEILKRLGGEYAKRGWALLLHLDAKRKTSPRLLELAGPAGGYAAVGGSFDSAAVCDLLGAMEAGGGLPDTVLFPLNLQDQAPLAVMQGSFSQDGIASKVQLGPAWWWCDHALGIRNTLSCIASFGVLSGFIGMTTDSRSILSFVRHDYFRRLLCSFIDEQNEQAEWEMTPAVQGELVRKICYQNAIDKIRRNEK